MVATNDSSCLEAESATSDATARLPKIAQSETPALVIFACAAANVLCFAFYTFHISGVLAYCYSIRLEIEVSFVVCYLRHCLLCDSATDSPLNMA